MIRVFYRVGLIGLKTEAFDTTTWSFVGRESVPEAELAGDTHVSVCPAFFRVLGVRPAARS